MRKLATAAEVVEALGGGEKVAALTDSNVKAVWNWHGYFDAFPPRTYVAMVRELERLGYTASPHLWKMHGFKKPKRAA